MSASTNGATAVGDGTSPARGVNTTLGLVLGAIYLLIGLVGFLLTGFDGFVSTDGPLLLGLFEINPLHNIVHLGVGALLLFGALKGTPTSRKVNILVGVVYLLVGVLGPFLTGSEANILALNSADHFLHIGSALALLAVGFGADRSARH